MNLREINRGSGFTESEQYLSELADRTFLRLWTYPNTFMNRKLSSVGSGKEICDLLVVCGDDVIIFSDKSISWLNSSDLNTSWSRWYRKAISSSIRQIVGAERWLTMHPDRVFLDQACTERLPIELPPSGNAESTALLLPWVHLKLVRNITVMMTVP